MTTLDKPKSLRLKSTAELRAILAGNETINIETAEELAAHAIEVELQERYEDPMGTTDADLRSPLAADDTPKLFEGVRLKIEIPAED